MTNPLEIGGKVLKEAEDHPLATLSLIAAAGGAIALHGRFGSAGVAERTLAAEGLNTGERFAAPTEGKLLFRAVTEPNGAVGSEIERDNGYITKLTHPDGARTVEANSFRLTKDPSGAIHDHNFYGSGEESQYASGHPGRVNRTLVFRPGDAEYNRLNGQFERLSAEHAALVPNAQV